MVAVRTKTAMIGPTLLPTPSMNVTGVTCGARPRRSRRRQPRDGEPRHDLADLARKPALDGLVVARSDGLDDDPPHGPHLVLAEATGCGGRRAQADAGRRVGWQRVERDAVLVDGD